MRNLMACVVLVCLSVCNTAAEGDFASYSQPSHLSTINR
jgi:hypothetical protein